jgi:alkylation response protein AidB-like acyl-CoA dehydrogenase
VQFRSAAEVELFAASVRGVLDARTPREEPPLGTWEDERDDELADGPERVRAWSATTLGYLAGLAAAAVDRTVEHVRSREQFGAPLGALPAVQARLADAGSVRDGLLLVAWTAADPDGPALPADELAWAGSACREVTATAHQLHGAIGFALETGLHRLYRRAKTVQAWTDAVCRSALQ